MDKSQSPPTTKSLIGFAGFCARHFLALLITVTVACIVWTIVYFALLLWAAFAGGGIGGPLAYPAGLLFVLVAAILAVIMLFLPAAGLAEWVARRRRLPILAQIPISVAFLAVFCLLLISIVHAVRDDDMTLGGFAAAFGVLFVIQLLPFGFYWWVAQAGPLLLSILRRFRLARDA